MTTDVHASLIESSVNSYVVTVWWEKSFLILEFISFYTSHFPILSFCGAEHQIQSLLRAKQELCHWAILPYFTIPLF